MRLIALISFLFVFTFPAFADHTKQYDKCVYIGTDFYTLQIQMENAIGLYFSCLASSEDTSDVSIELIHDSKILPGGGQRVYLKGIVQEDHEEVGRWESKSRIFHLTDFDEVYRTPEDIHIDALYEGIRGMFYALFGHEFTNNTDPLAES